MRLLASATFPGNMEYEEIEETDGEEMGSVKRGLLMLFSR